MEPLESRIQYSATLLPLGARVGSPRTKTTVVGDATVVSVRSYSRVSNEWLHAGSAGDYLNAWPVAGTFSEFTLNVTTAGDYTLTLRAAAFSTASVQILDNGANAGTLALPATGSWKTTAAATLHLTLPAGVQTLRIQSNAAVGYNLFGVDLSLNTPTTTADGPLPTPMPAPVLPPTDPMPVTPSGGSATNPTTDPVISPGLNARAVLLNEHAQGNFNELDVTGTTIGETVTVTQSGGTLTINANGQMYHNTMALGELVIFAGAGTDTILVDSSVTIPTRIYSGQGNDTITNLTTGQATIVTLDGYANKVTGNGINTAYWVTSADTVNASAAEKNAGGVHTIGSFYQPYTLTPGATGYVTNVRDGSNLVDPASDGAGWTRPTASLWGLRPVQEDVNQGQVGDCYFLTDMQSLARLQPSRLQQMAVDLGDGTYAVQFYRGGSAVYVRVDGDLPTAPWGGLYYAHPGASGNEWVAIMEKAYAYFRTGANAYSSLNSGYMTGAYSDLGVSSASIVLPADQNSFLSTVNTQLAANKPVDVLTHGTIINSAPLIASHCYAVISATKDAGGTVWITLRNPWGFDGFNVDSNPNDGLVTVSYAALYANVTYASLVQ
jgi:hypothetical protein